MIEHFHRHVLPATYSLLPPQMESLEASAMLLAIGLHESKFQFRRQVGGGPARGLLQFERNGGIKGVCTHPSTRVPLNLALNQLKFGAMVGQTAQLHKLVEFNDTVACIFARLLLWTLPAHLPGRDDVDEAFKQYLTAWKPGAWTRGTPAKRAKLRTEWGEHYPRAWTLVAPQEG